MSRVPPSRVSRPRWLSGRVAALALLLLGSAGPLAGGTIAVSAGAAYMSGFGAEIALVESCIWGDDRTVDSPPVFEGLLAACDNLAVEGVRLVGSTSILQAGESIRLGDGFATAPGAAAAAVLGTPLTRMAFLTDDTPDAKTTYSAAYRLDLDGLTLAAADSFASLIGRSQDGTEHFRVIVSRHAGLGENRLRIRAREDDGGEVEGPEVLLPAGYNLIEVKWVAGPGTGSAMVAINGSVFSGPTLLDNDRARIDRVLWGAVDGSLEGSSGSLEQDEFSSGL